MAVHVTETLKDHEKRITTSEKECASCRASKVEWDNHNELRARVGELDKRYAVEIATIKAEAKSAAKTRAFWVSLVASTLTSVIVGLVVFYLTKSS